MLIGNLELPYWIQIQFIGQYGLIRFWDITEGCNSLEEARSYISLIDNTVNKGQIVDTKNMSVVEYIK